MSQRLTASLIKGLVPRQRRYVITDDKTPGLAVVTNPSGNKYFYYRYRPVGSSGIIEEPIGNASFLSLDDARAAVKIKAGEAAKGVDFKQQWQTLKSQQKMTKLNKSLQLFNYIDESYAKKNNVTAKQILKVLRREFEFIKNKPIDQIGSKEIDHWRENRCDKITFATLKRYYTQLKACINTAVKHYKLIGQFELQNYVFKRRIAEKVNPPKVRYLTRDEERHLLDALKERDSGLREQREYYVQWQAKRNHGREHKESFGAVDYPDHITPIVMLGYHTGFDIGDIFDFDWQEHIDFANNQIRKIRNKTKHKQDNPQPVVVPMSATVRKVLAQWGRQHGKKGRVFKSPKTGGKLDNIKNGRNSVVEEAELYNFRFKDLRHTFGSWLAISGADLLDIRDLMGHKDIKTTQIYAHLCPKKKINAVTAVFS